MAIFGIPTSSEEYQVMKFKEEREKAVNYVYNLIKKIVPDIPQDRGYEIANGIFNELYPDYEDYITFANENGPMSLKKKAGFFGFQGNYSDDIKNKIDIDKLRNRIISEEMGRRNISSNDVMVNDDSAKTLNNILNGREQFSYNSLNKALDTIKEKNKQNSLSVSDSLTGLDNFREKLRKSRINRLGRSVRPNIYV